MDSERRQDSFVIARQARNLIPISFAGRATKKPGYARLARARKDTGYPAAKTGILKMTMRIEKIHTASTG
jgi:hypothetical protein